MIKTRIKKLSEGDIYALIRAMEVVKPTQCILLRCMKGLKWCAICLFKFILLFFCALMIRRSSLATGNSVPHHFFLC